MSRNQLDQESSPYLLLHKDNPVHWRPWGPQALAEAETSNKPILLSIGYAACHWCHVMNHESFADPDTAAVMNEHFVNIKVDREERPDIDQIYQTAAQTLGQHGGWPLTMFLTPKGAPFVAGNYFPKEERSGQTPFKTVLNEVARLYREQPEPVADIASRATQQLNALSSRSMGGRIDQTFLNSAAVRIGQSFDIFFGGPTGKMKFPSVTSLETLWRAYLRTGLPQFHQLVSTTLDNMLQAGIYDHVGGGFARYATDERWLVPHFEKMLYDNAMLLEFLTRFWQHKANPLVRTRIAETIGWLMREMKVGDAFASSLDADSEGEEGKYYLWTEAEIDEVLKGTLVDRFKAAYNVRPEGNFEGKSILYRIGSPRPYPQAPADEVMFAKQRERLLAARQRRVAPFRDDKILADWNALLIVALAEAGTTFRRLEWTTAAIGAFDFILAHMSEGDRLWHSWREGKRGAPGFADDYAQMARAALALFELVGEKRYLDYARRWTATLDAHFWDAQNGGYFFTGDDADPLIVRTRMIYDQPTPSANGTMLNVLARLSMITGEPAYAQRAAALSNGFTGEAQRNYMSMGAFLNGFDYALNAVQIIIVGAVSHAKTHELVAAVLKRSLPNRCLLVVSPQEMLPKTHPAHGKTMLNGAPTAYVCRGNSCSAPVTEASALSDLLQTPQPQPRRAPAASRRA